MYMDVLRGDNLSHLVSMSSNEAALSKALRVGRTRVASACLARQMRGCEHHPHSDHGGKSIMLQFDTHTGRPYSRLNKLVARGAQPAIRPPLP